MATTAKTATKPVTFTIKSEVGYGLYEVTIVKGESIRIRCSKVVGSRPVGTFTIWSSAGGAKWSKDPAILEAIKGRGREFESGLGRLLAAKEYGVAGDMLEDIGVDRAAIGPHSTIYATEDCENIERKHDITCRIGDLAEYHSYNLSYIGRIVSITDKTVTIKDSDETRRLKLDEFCWRNYNGIENKLNCAMTKNQWRMLEILDTWGGMGTIEVEIQWGDYDFGDTEADERKGWAVCRLVVAGLMRTLIAKGYADDSDGYDITDAGRAALERHGKRKVKH